MIMTRVRCGSYLLQDQLLTFDETAEFAASVIESCVGVEQERLPIRAQTVVGQVYVEYFLFMNTLYFDDWNSRRCYRTNFNDIFSHKQNF